MAGLFDVYVFVDWSATTKPRPRRESKDSIWIGEGSHQFASVPPKYCRTRQEAESHLRQRLAEHVASGRRVLIGFDFPYGYPSGFAHALGMNDTNAWLQIWSRITQGIDDRHGTNNRLEFAAEINRSCSVTNSGPFWLVTSSKDPRGLPLRQPQYPFPAPNDVRLARNRIAECRARGTQPAWKLGGPGSVGGQALMGIPYVNRLYKCFGPHIISFVWPFDTGFSLQRVDRPGPAIVHAEIWPGTVEHMVRLRNSEIRDNAQVQEMVTWAVREDADGRLGSWFEAPANLTGDEIQTCVEEEGWILGVG